MTKDVKDTKEKLYTPVFLQRENITCQTLHPPMKKLKNSMKDYGDGNVTSSWDKVTTFYNKQGKKLFKFGLAYDNVQLLVKEVKNTQKVFQIRKEEIEQSVVREGGIMQ